MRRASAIGHRSAGGGKRIGAVYRRPGVPVTPCGGCRQRLREFAGAETKLHLCDNDGVVETVTMGDMLPYGFAGDILK